MEPNKTSPDNPGAGMNTRATSKWEERSPEGTRNLVIAVLLCLLIGGWLGVKGAEHGLWGNIPTQPVTASPVKVEVVMPDCCCCCCKAPVVTEKKVEAPVVKKLAPPPKPVAKKAEPVPTYVKAAPPPVVKKDDEMPLGETPKAICPPDMINRNGGKATGRTSCSEH
jgi:hypothetical protein